MLTFLLVDAVHFQIDPEDIKIVLKVNSRTDEREKLN